MTTDVSTRSAEQRVNDLLLQMDMVDQIRHYDANIAAHADHREHLVNLKADLRRLYTAQGIEVTEAQLEYGVQAALAKRFAHTPLAGRKKLLAYSWIWRGTAVGLLAASIALTAGVGALAYHVGVTRPAERMAAKEMIERKMLVDSEANREALLQDIALLEGWASDASRASAGVGTRLMPAVRDLAQARAAIEAAPDIEAEAPGAAVSARAAAFQKAATYITSAAIDIVPMFSLGALTTERDRIQGILADSGLPLSSAQEVESLIEVASQALARADVGTAERRLHDAMHLLSERLNADALRQQIQPLVEEIATLPIPPRDAPFVRPLLERAKSPPVESMAIRTLITDLTSVIKLARVDATFKAELAPSGDIDLVPKKLRGKRVRYVMITPYDPAGAPIAMQVEDEGTGQVRSTDWFGVYATTAAIDRLMDEVANRGPRESITVGKKPYGALTPEWVDGLGGGYVHGR